MTRAADGDWAGAVPALDLALAAGDAGRGPRRAGQPGQRRTAARRRRSAQQHFYALALSRAREAGAVMVVIYALQRMCFGHLAAGDWAALRSSADEALALATQPRPARADRSAAGLAHPAGRAPGPRRLRHPARRPRGGGRRAPAGHPDRPGPRPDPLGQGRARRSRGRRLRRAAPPLPDAPARPGPDGRRATASTPRSAPEQPDLARRWVDELAAFADATGRPWALADVAYGRAMTTDAGDSNARMTSSPCSTSAGPPRPRRARRRRGPYPPRVRGVAAPYPAPRRRPRTPAPRAGDVHRPARRPRSSNAPPRSCAPPARPPASGTRPPWSS